jgi:hypothetical protein
MFRLAVVAVLLFAALSSFIQPQDWEADYGIWRNRRSATIGEWRSKFPVPLNQTPPLEEFHGMDVPTKREHFYSCLTKQALAFSRHVMQYKSPKLSDVQARVRRELDARGFKVALAVFWGRLRYVTILWKYLERNLRVNGGIVDELQLVHANHTAANTVDGNLIFLDAISAKYPGVVLNIPFCKKFFGCAFDEHFIDPLTIYVKIDDDTAFIKDGSIEHLALEVMLNKEYSFFSGSVVNHPHTAALHRFIGAYARSSYHFEYMARVSPPFYDAEKVPMLYYGGMNLYEGQGTTSHQSFVYNIAMNRLDMYTFDVWNLNQCRCAEPQQNYVYCNEDGYYRWGINALAFTRNVSKQYKWGTPAFDEPAVTVEWPRFVAPHRVGLIGEALFVHVQYNKQRQSGPDYGLREDVLLPWFNELADAYTAVPYGGWQGNRTLLLRFEEMMEGVGEKRFSASVTHHCTGSTMLYEREHCKNLTWKV